MLQYERAVKAKWEKTVTSATYFMILFIWNSQEVKDLGFEPKHLVLRLEAAYVLSHYFSSTK
jgi:hypothetical protein